MTHRRLGLARMGQLRDLRTSQWAWDPVLWPFNTSPRTQLDPPRVSLTDSGPLSLNRERLVVSVWTLQLMKS